MSSLKRLIKGNQLEDAVRPCTCCCCRSLSRQRKRSSLLLDLHHDPLERGVILIMQDDLEPIESTLVDAQAAVQLEQVNCPAVVGQDVHSIGCASIDAHASLLSIVSECVHSNSMQI